MPRKKGERMNILRRTLMALGSMTLVAVVIALAVPKAPHGVVATLVQVVNTSANSVPTSDAGAALEPFEFEAISQTTPVNSTSFTTPSTTAAGRAVQRLVME